MTKFEAGKTYIAKCDYREEVPYLGIDEVKKGERVTFAYKNLGYAKFRKEDGSIFTVDAPVAFKLFKEEENVKTN